jgi:hypothetical protein
VAPALRVGAGSSSVSEGRQTEMVGVGELAAWDVAISEAGVVQQGELTSALERRAGEFRGLSSATAVDRSTATKAPRWFYREIVRHQEESAQTEGPVVD